jgi:hypothetical protein
VILSPAQATDSLLQAGSGLEEESEVKARLKGSKTLLNRWAIFHEPEA